MQEKCRKSKLLPRRVCLARNSSRPSGTGRERSRSDSRPPLCAIRNRGKSQAWKRAAGNPHSPPQKSERGTLVPFREPSRLCGRAAPRNRHPSRTVRAQPEYITACACVANQNHPNLALAQVQKLPALRSSGRVQIKLKLHALSKRIVTELGKPVLISSALCRMQPPFVRQLQPRSWCVPFSALG